MELQALADLLGVRAQGLHSRFHNSAEVDAPYKFFFNLEKKNGQNRLIHCIRDNISLIRNYLEVSGSLDSKFGLISLDQQKAFDLVEHQYLWTTFKAFGFSPGFITTIKTLCSDIES